jgi:signal transduction histidine kinase/EAL domain-containing protein (putative c-di-GMP-specific phosphodiesterase class I)/response regulator RpfG family c-di-GMP phosphodiesterase
VTLRSPSLLDYDAKQALREYWTFFAPFRAAILDEVKRDAPDNPFIAQLSRDEADDWRLEHLAINANAWTPFLERLHTRGVAYARSEMPYSVWFEHLSKLRDRSLTILNEHPERAGSAAAIMRGALLAYDINHEIIGRAYFEAKEQAARNALRRSEELLQHSQKMDALGRLAGGVAHDFNNILTVVQSYACMLEEALDTSDVRRQDATEIRRAADRATKLTRQLLTLSRQGATAPKPTSVDDLIAAFIPSLRRLLGNSVTLDVRRGNTPTVIVDPSQLEQVVMNLAVNARDAMNGKGRLTVETSTVDLDLEAATLHGLAAGRYVVLAVSDTGSGISPEVQRRIFDPFFTTKEPGMGTGLGLSIVHGIIAQAGGAIDVYSERSHGTTFRVRLPAQSDAAVVTVEAAKPAPRELRPVTVLFVDAQAELRTLASRVLGAAGCTVIEAATGEEARRACVTFDGAIDVVVVDVALADERGDTLVRTLRELRPELRVILTSGFPSSALAPSGDARSELLAKPFTPNQLREAVAAATYDGDQPTQRSEPTLLPRVLIADDDPLLRKMLSRLLRRAAFDVIEVDSGRAALAELATKRVDVILSDIHMPDGDGLELLRSVRRVDLDIPVILMSGKPDVATAATALEYGAFRYLTKPLGTETVEKLVRQGARAHALARIRREAATIGGANAGAGDRAGLEVRFDQALDRLWMAFQPIVHARDGTLFGVEALMRSDEPSLAGPGPMLDAATQLGRLSALGRRTRQLAGRAIAPSGIPILFMNLHPLDLLDVELIDERAPLTQIAARVVLEVTERESLVTSAALTERLERLRQLGFRLAIDDIGAGYSGLTSFTDLTPEIVKIDMSLVRSIHTSTVKQRTVGALCALCHEIGTLVVGEGVETEEEQACLVDLGCDLLQGFLIARPNRELPHA